MKNLLLIRHAKSSWKDPALTDLQRPLKKRGIANAREMARRLESLDHGVQQVLASPARRVVETIDTMCDETGFAADLVTVVPELYTFDYDEMMVSLKKLNDQWQSVAVVGHNPAITDLVNFLALEQMSTIPTGGLTLLGVDIEHWADLCAGCARVIHYDYPKSEALID